MRPSDQAPDAAPLMRKDSSSFDERVRTRAAARQRQVALTSPPTSGDDHNTIRRADGRSTEGEVHFFLQRIAGGLYVEREEVPRRGTRTIQSIVFDDRRSFER